MINSPQLLHHLRRKRTYNRHEKWGVFAALGIMTVLVGSTTFLWDGKRAESSVSYSIESVEAPTEIQLSNPQDATATITVTDQTTNLPATNLWVGLMITDPKDRDHEYTYHDWYSPVPARAFFSTDTKGQVSFPLKTLKPGVVEYQIYTADPEKDGADKYHSLEKSFTVTYW